MEEIYLLSKNLYNQFPKSFFIFIDRKNKDINKSISKSKSVFLIMIGV